MLKKYNWLYCIIFSFGLLLFFNNSFAVENPEIILKDTVAQLQKEVNAKKANLSNSPDKLYELVQKDVIPILDVEQMAGMTLGPKWRTVTPKEKQQFIEQFGKLVTRTYAKALLSVSDYKISFNPIRKKVWQEQKYVAVKGQVTPLDGGQPSSVVYYMVRSGNSWLIYDFAVEGVSFVQNFRSQLQGFSDMAKLLKQITEANNKAVAK